MKEAAGEANMTVITIILIGVIAAVAVPLVKNAMDSVQVKGQCNAAGGYMDQGTCKDGNGNTIQLNSNKAE